MSNAVTMSDEAALLAAVREHPDCDAPRLAYADWLDERGYGERAAFIRVQCEIAREEQGPCERMDGWGQRHPCTPEKKCERCQRLHQLRRCQHELFVGTNLKSNLTAWFPGPSLDGYVFLLVPPKSYSPADVPFCVVRRGFVDAVYLSLRDFAGGACGACGGSGRSAGEMWAANYPCRTCSSTGRTAGHAETLFAEHPIQTVVLADAGRRVEIDPPGEGHGWQAYFYYADESDPVGFHSWCSRGEMVKEIAAWAAAF